MIDTVTEMKKASKWRQKRFVSEEMFDIKYHPMNENNVENDFLKLLDMKGVFSGNYIKKEANDKLLIERVALKMRNINP